MSLPSGYLMPLSQTAPILPSQNSAPKQCPLSPIPPKEKRQTKTKKGGQRTGILIVFKTNPNLCVLMGRHRQPGLALDVFFGEVDVAVGGPVLDLDIYPLERSVYKRNNASSFWLALVAFVMFSFWGRDESKGKEGMYAWPTFVVTITRESKPANEKTNRFF